MTATRFAKAGSFLLVIAAVLAYYVHAQKPSLQEFFQALVDHYDPSSLPKYETLRRVTGQIERLPPEEITRALPAIFAALAHQDKTVTGCADSALYAIALRPDSADLLRSRIDALGHNILTSPNPDTRAGGIVILGSLKPTPPPEVLPIFLTFLKRTDADAQAQGSSVIFELLHIAPQDPGVIAAIQEFLSRPLDNSAKIGVLNALGNPEVKDAHLLAALVASLDDPDQGVRSAAVQALTRIGNSAFQQAEPALQRLAKDPKQPPEVIAAAKEALQRLHPPNN